MNFDGVDSRIMGVKISLICESTSIMVIDLLLITVEVVSILVQCKCY